MKRWLHYARPYARYFVIGPLCMIVEVLGEILLPSLYGSIVNVGIAEQNVWYIAGVCGLMILTAVLMMTGGVGGAYFASKASVNYAADLRRDVYSKIQKFSFANIDRFSTGSLVTRLTNDVTQIMNMINMLMRMCLRAPGMLIGALIMTIAMNPSLAVVLAVSIPLLAVIIVTIWKSLGYAMIFYLSALEKVPKELYEASSLDGAKGWQRFRDVTLPGVSPTTFFLSIITMVNSLQAYDQIQILTQGGASGSTRTLLYMYYQLGFEEFSMGQATAVAIVLILITIVLSAVQFTASKKWVHY